MEEMNAQSKWEKIENNVGVLEVEVDVDSVTNALDRAFKKVIKSVNLPGFRKGKAPRHLFEKRYGVEVLYNDALDLLLPEAYSKAVTEADLNPVSRPDIEVVQIEKGKPLVFKATVTVKPEVVLGTYKGVKVEKHEFLVTEEQVDAELKSLQQNHAELSVMEEGQVETGDTVIIDFLGMLDGVPFEGGEAENYQLEVGSGTFIPGFEDQLIGLEKGGSRDITVTFPEEYHVPSLASQEVVFQIKLHEIKRKHLPILDDEFAKDVSEFETLAELRQDLEAKLQESALNSQKNDIEEQVIDKAVESATIDLPAIMIENEIDTMVEEFKQRLQMQGIPFDAYIQLTGNSDESIRSEMKENAEKRVRRGLVLEAIAISEGIEASDEDLEAEFAKIAETAKIDVEQVKNILSNRDPHFHGMKSDVKTRKTIELLIEHSEVA